MERYYSNLHSSAHAITGTHVIIVKARTMIKIRADFSTIPESKKLQTKHTKIGTIITAFPRAFFLHRSAHLP